MSFLILLAWSVGFSDGDNAHAIAILSKYQYNCSTKGHNQMMEHSRLPTANRKITWREPGPVERTDA
jgi:hypothetical protein